MLSSGFTSAPVSRLLFFGIISSSLLVSIADWKSYFHTPLLPILWRNNQPWRLLIWQLTFTNSTELLFAAMLLYNLRIIERLWGSRKFASFLLSLYVPSTLLPPLLHTTLYPLSLHHLPTLLPAGPTPLLFALLAQYHDAIPTVYKYHILTSAQPSTPSTSTSPQSLEQSHLALSDKTPTYLLALQLALSSLPLSPLLAALGYTLGLAWRETWGPGWWSSWRVSRWLVGEEKLKWDLRGALQSGGAGNRRSEGQGTGADGGAAGGFEGLRRRMEGESRRDMGLSGGGGVGEQQEGVGRRVFDTFRGAF